MKGRTLIWLLLMAVALVGCHNSTPSEEMCPEASLHLELTSIDTLMQCCPDSALAMLLDTSFDEPYHQLLLSEALYKNDYQQANRQELLVSMAYYDSVLARTQAPSAAFLDARCHYMNGVGYYEMDSVVSACAEYLKALEIMENHFKEKDLVGHKAKFMALIHTRLCKLFSDQYLHEQSVFFGKRALCFYNKYDAEAAHVAWVLNNIGLHYQVMEELDSARYYFELVMARIPDTNNIAYRDASTAHASLSYALGANTQLVLEQLHTLLIQSENSTEYLSRCLSIGGVFYMEQQFDSAWKYLNTVFNESPMVGSKKQAAEWLVDICKARGQDDDLLTYAGYLAPFANLEEYKSELKSQLTETYKTSCQNRLEHHHQEKISHIFKQTAIIFAVLFFVLFVITLLYHRNKRKNHCLEIQIKEEKRAHEMKQKALSGRLKNSNKALRETMKIMEKRETKNESQEPKDIKPTLERYEDFKHTAICQEIFDRVEKLHSDKKKVLKTDMDVTSYKSFALSKTQLVLLSKMVDEHFPYYFASLKKLYPSLSPKDWRFCLLYLLQLDKLSICILLQESYHTCRRYTLKLEEAFHCEHDLSAFLVEHILH